MSKFVSMLGSFARRRCQLALCAIVFVCCTIFALAEEKSPGAATSGSLFVMADYWANATRILDSSYKQIAVVPEYGYEAIGADGTLYIARQITGHATNSLTIYAPPYKKQSAVLTYGGFITTGVATDPLHHIFAVTGLYAEGYGGAGFIRFYKDGTTKPCRYITFGPGSLSDGSAFDRLGTFYSGAPFNKQTFIVSVAGGCGASQFVVHTLPPGTQVDGRFVFDNDNHLLLQQNYSNVVSIYANPGNGPFGPPIASTTLQNVDGDTPYFACLASDGKHLWANTNAGLAEYLYPQGGAPLVVLPRIPKYGLIAVFPPF
jgi:hypothetical protein